MNIKPVFTGTVADNQASRARPEPRNFSSYRSPKVGTSHKMREIRDLYSERVNAKEAAKFLKVSRTTFYRLIESGIIPKSDNGEYLLGEIVESYWRNAKNLPPVGVQEELTKQRAKANIELKLAKAKLYEAKVQEKLKELAKQESFDDELNGPDNQEFADSDMTISQWADEERQLSFESCATPGNWLTSRAEYQREIMDSILNPLTERVVMMTAAQVGKTELLLNVIGYFVDKQSGPMLILQPTLEMGASFSKERLAPMIRDTPCLTRKFGNPKSRNSGNTLRHKIFESGYVTIAGANSPASLASRPIRILLCDEVDRYPESAGAEGDPLALATKRTQNFNNRKIFYVSTPSLIETSRIYKAYLESTCEEWNIPCPDCGGVQTYQWDRIIYKDVSEPLMRCEHCGKAFNESEWKAQQSLGKWIAKYPERINTRGFHMNAFASPWASWKNLISQYNEALNTGEESIKVWINTVLGLPYESSDATIEAEKLESHRDDYGAELPDGVLALTCGVDTQDDRLELEIVGWGANKESWGIEYRIIYGNPILPDTWLKLDEILSGRYSYSNGDTLGISCTFIDSAGHYTDEVYKFCKPRKNRFIFPIIGRGRTGMDIVSKPSRNNRRRVMLFTVGVSTVKGELMQRLQLNDKGPGYCHFPKGLTSNDNRGYDTTYFKGLLSEHVITKRRNGRNVLAWEVKAPGLRNEPLDCRVYATAAMELMDFDFSRLRIKRASNIDTQATIKLEKPEIPLERHEGHERHKGQTSAMIARINRHKRRFFKAGLRA